MRRDLDQATTVARGILQALARGDRPTAVALLHAEDGDAFERAASTILATMQFDVKESEQLARQVRSLRRSRAHSMRP